MQDKQVKHYKDMTREELMELVCSMSWMALNLAQHLEYTTNCLQVQYRKDCYRRAIEMAWQICYAWEYEKPQGNMEVAYFGGNGLEVINGEVSQLLDETLPHNIDTQEKEFDYNDFDQLYMFLDEAIPSDEDIRKNENTLKYFREITSDKFSKDFVEIKVKTLKNAIWKMERISDLAKAARKMIEMINDKK
jgi:hypothetical protein